MGATLLLTTDAGQFSLDQIDEYLRGVLGLVDSDDDPCFVGFSDATTRRRVRRALNLCDPAAPEHHSPYLRYSPTLIEFGINWSDN